MNSPLRKLPFSELAGSDILNAPEQTIICTTNIVGAMGRGIALSTKKRYPKVYKIYRKEFESGNMTPNTLILVPVAPDKNILLFPTKIDWRDKSPVQLILDNLNKLAKYGDSNLGITSLAIPPLGMSNGWLRGMDAKTVMSAIENYSTQVSHSCTFYY